MTQFGEFQPRSDTHNPYLDPLLEHKKAIGQNVRRAHRDEEHPSAIPAAAAEQIDTTPDKAESLRQAERELISEIDILLRRSED